MDDVRWLIAREVPYLRRCARAIVGDPDQVRAKLDAYRAVGVDAFILSGYPHLDECDRFARLVLRDMPHAPLGGRS